MSFSPITCSCFLSLGKDRREVKGEISKRDQVPSLRLCVWNSLKDAVICKWSWLRSASQNTSTGHMSLHLAGIQPLLCPSFFRGVKTKIKTDNKSPASSSTAIHFNANDFASSPLMAMDFADILKNVCAWGEEPIFCLPEQQVSLVRAVPKAWYNVGLQCLLGYPSTD